LAKDRRRAIGRDADDDRRAIDDRTELELGKCRLVDDIDGHARAFRRFGKCRGFGIIFEIPNRNRGACKDVRRPNLRIASLPIASLRIPSPRMMGDCIVCRRGKARGHFGFWDFGIDVNVGAGRRQQFAFPCRGRCAAGHDGALARKIEKHRQLRELADTRWR